MTSPHSGGGLEGTTYPERLVFRVGPRVVVQHIVDTDSGTAIVALCGRITHRTLYPGEDRWLGVCRKCTKKADRIVTKESTR